VARRFQVFSHDTRGDACPDFQHFDYVNPTFASLMARATDEPDALYGLAAGVVRISTDGAVAPFERHSHDMRWRPDWLAFSSP
jgi:hypothetical protein